MADKNLEKHTSGGEGELTMYTFANIQKEIKLDDSAFFRTQSYITEICYFEYLLSFGLQKTFISKVQSHIKPN